MTETILDADGVAACIDRLAAAISERHPQLDQLAIIGIRRRGVPLARRVSTRLEALRGSAPLTGALDITLYRDDLTLIADQPIVHKTEVDFNVDGLHVVLVDDVLFTGRTVRAAIDAVFSLGRPAKIELAVLVDRGHRELPFQATYVGQRVDTALGDRVSVRVPEIDDADEVTVTRGSA